MKTSNFFKKNSMWILLGLLLLAVIGTVILVWLKPKEHFENDNTTPQRKLEYFYMDGCPHCVEFHPVWDELVKAISVKPFKYEVSTGVGKERADLFKVTSAPTILLTEDDKVLKEYSGKRDVESILAFLASS